MSTHPNPHTPGDTPGTAPADGGSGDSKPIPSKAAPKGSILGRLRQRYDESVAQRQRLFELPWLDGLWGLFTPIDIADFERLKKVSNPSTDENVLYTAEALVAHCQEIYYGDTRETARPFGEIIAEEAGGGTAPTIRFDRQLGTIFGLPEVILDSPRGVMLALLTRTEDKLPFMAFADEILKWSAKQTGEAVESVLGE